MLPTSCRAGDHSYAFRIQIVKESPKGDFCICKHTGGWKIVQRAKFYLAVWFSMGKSANTCPLRDFIGTWISVSAKNIMIKQCSSAEEHVTKWKQEHLS